MNNSIVKTVLFLIALAVGPNTSTAFQDNESSAKAPAAESAELLNATIPEWWLEAVEKISYPDKLALQTELMKTRFEAEAALDSLISQATRDYFGNHLSQRDLNEISNAKEFLRQFTVVEGRCLVLAIQMDPSANSNGKGSKQEIKYRGYAQVEFSEALWQRRVVRDRLLIALGSCGTILSGLAMLTVFLHLNHATKGMYAGRLQMAAAVAFAFMMLMIFWISKFVI